MRLMRCGIAFFFICFGGLAFCQTPQIQFEIDQKLIQARAQAGSVGFISNRSFYLQQPLFQKELGLSELQIGKLKQMNDRLQEIYKTPGADRTAWSKKIQEIQSTNEKELATLLRPEQTRRFREVYLRQLGDSVFFDPTVASTLSLSENQKQIQTELRTDISKLTTDLYRASFSNITDYAAFNNEIRSYSMIILTATLTTDQKKVLEGLLGPPLQK